MHPIAAAMETPAVIRMPSVKENMRMVGMLTSSNARKVLHPMMPTGTPFSTVLRLLTFSECQTDQKLSSRAHVRTSSDMQTTMMVTNSSI